jgi:hypothetical protein
MIGAYAEDGWIRVAYGGSDLSRVEIGIGEVPDFWQPAFLHTTADGRVAQIRPPQFGFNEAPKVWLRTDGVPVLIGVLGETIQAPGRRQRRG